ncbi:MAG: aromatic amino acid DMT transporter YddG [Anaerolineae bacterium]|nr:aromatic amino acid DMT transporter YddG [Anaerolineae bacterium]
MPTKKADTGHLADTGAGFVSVLIWSASIAFGRSLSRQVGSLTAISLINLVGGGVGLTWQVLRGHHKNRNWRFPPAYLLGCGSLYVIYQASLYVALGLARTGSQVLEVGLLNYLWPMLTLLFSVWLFQMRFHFWLIPGALIAVAGVILATSQNQVLSWASFAGNFQQNAAPYLLGLSAAVSWALYSTLSRKWAGDLPGNAVPAFMLAAAVVLGLTRLLILDEDTVWTQRALLEFAFLAVGSNIAYVLWERAVRRGDIILVAAISYFTPLFSTLTSTFYLRIQPDARLWAGCVMVIGGALLCKLAVPEGG